METKQPLDVVKLILTALNALPHDRVPVPGRVWLATQHGLDRAVCILEWPGGPNCVLQVSVPTQRTQEASCRRTTPPPVPASVGSTMQVEVTDLIDDEPITAVYNDPGFGYRASRRPECQASL